MYSAWGRRLGSSIVTLLIAVAQATPAAAQQSATEAGLGRQLFDGQCAICHGAGGTGGEAPDLTRPRLPRAPDDNALRTVIETGFAPRMPGLRARPRLRGLRVDRGTVRELNGLCRGAAARG